MPANFAPARTATSNPAASSISASVLACESPFPLFQPTRSVPDLVFLLGYLADNAFGSLPRQDHNHAAPRYAPSTIDISETYDFFYSIVTIEKFKPQT